MQTSMPMPEIDNLLRTFFLELRLLDLEALCNGFKAAILGYAVQRDRAKAAIAELTQALSGVEPASASPAPAKPKRHISEAGKTAIKKAQKKRWQVFYAQKEAEARKAQKPRKAQKTKPAAKTTKAKRALSKAQLRAMRENVKKARAAKLHVVAA